MSGTTPPTPLSPAVLARRLELPLKPTPVTLVGRYVRLEPLQVARDAAALFEVSSGRACARAGREVNAYDADALIWRFMFDGPFERLEDLAEWLQLQVSAQNGLCFVVLDAPSGDAVGVTNFMNNSPEHLRIELGGIWYSPLVQRTWANTEAAYLMLAHAFELGYRRIDWKCHSDNVRSREAALKLGFVFEGIQDAHMIVKDRNRDTAWFRMLDTDWPRVRPRLETRLYGCGPGLDGRAR